MEIENSFNQIRDFLTNYYDGDDLGSLFFEIYGDGIDILGKDLPRPKLAQKMVVYCNRRGDLPKLLSAMERTRKDIYLKTIPPFPDLSGSIAGRLKPGESITQQVKLDGRNLPRVQKEVGYIIDEPPADWITEELTDAEVFSKRLGGSPNKSAPPGKRDNLWISSQSQLKIEYDPGRSLINGRQTLSIVPEIYPVALLMIIPLERNSTPPAFMRQSFEQTFLTNIAIFLGLTNLKSSFASTIKNTNRLRLTAEFDQRFENAIVDGRPDQSFTINQTVICIQGFVRDYLLELCYVSQASSNKAEIESQVALLQSLVDSFQLINPTDLEESERQSQEVGNRLYQEFVEQNAKQILENQFNLLIEQWRELDWKKKESRQRVIQDTKRFKKAIEVFTGDKLNAKQIWENQFNLLILQWIELDWKKKKSRQRVIQDTKRFKKAIEVFTENDKSLAKVAGSLDEFEQMSFNEMKYVFISNDSQEH